MATPPNRSTANTNALAQLATIQSAADQIFIDGATAAILSAIAQGKLEVTVTSFEDCNLQTLHDYFVSFGYDVSYPGLGMKPGPAPFQPAELFGMLWDQFWANFQMQPPLQNPTQVTLAWRTP